MLNITKGNPHAVAAELGLEIRYEKLPAGRHGLYRGDHIAITPGLTQREERSTLAHELGHHEYGHTHVPQFFAPRLEAACDLYAAEMLIDEYELLRLAQLYPEDPARIAYELDVASWVLDAWVRAHPLPHHQDTAA